MKRLPPLSLLAAQVDRPGAASVPTSTVDLVDRQTWNILRALKAEVRDLQAALQAEQQSHKDDVERLSKELRECREELDRGRSIRGADADIQGRNEAVEEIPGMAEATKRWEQDRCCARAVPKVQLAIDPQEDLPAKVVTPTNSDALALEGAPRCARRIVVVSHATSEASALNRAASRSATPAGHSVLAQADGDRPRAAAWLAAQQSQQAKPKQRSARESKDSSIDVDLRCGHRFPLAKLEAARRAAEACRAAGLAQPDALVCPLCGDQGGSMQTVYSSHTDAYMGDLRRDWQQPLRLPGQARATSVAAATGATTPRGGALEMRTGSASGRIR